MKRLTAILTVLVLSLTMYSCKNTERTESSKETVEKKSAVYSEEASSKIKAEEKQEETATMASNESEDLLGSSGTESKNGSQSKNIPDLGNVTVTMEDTEPKNNDNTTSKVNSSTPTDSEDSQYTSGYH